MAGFLRSRRKRSAAQGEDTADEGLGRHLVAAHEPNSLAAEAYRSLRTNLLYSFVDNPPKAIVLTSPGVTEGKSTTCANLGVVLAQAGKSVLVVDCDLRRPSLHKLFGVRNIRGIVDILAGESSFEAASTEPVTGLTLVCAGPLPINPAEILGTMRFADFVGQARETFDYVLLDAPPVGFVTDPAILSSLADGVLLVLDAQNTRKGAARQSMRSLSAVRANVLGTVMNNVLVGKANQYNYGAYLYELQR